MMVTQAFRYELDPTVRQRRLLARSAGTARYAFNWGLALCKARLEAKQPVPSAAALHRRWNAEKPQRSRVYGVSKCWHCATWTAPSRTSGEDARGGGTSASRAFARSTDGGPHSGSQGPSRFILGR